MPQRKKTSEELKERSKAAVRERVRLKRQDPVYRAAERARNAEAHRRFRQDPVRRRLEQIRNTELRRRARQDPARHRLEQIRNTEAHRLARQDLARHHWERDAKDHRLARQDLARCLKEKMRNTEARRRAREDARCLLQEQGIHFTISDWEDVVLSYSHDIQDPAMAGGGNWLENVTIKVEPSDINPDLDNNGCNSTVPTDSVTTPFLCDTTGCGPSFCSRQTLQIHTGEEPFTEQDDQPVVEASQQVASRAPIKADPGGYEATPGQPESSKSGKGQKRSGWARIRSRLVAKTVGRGLIPSQVNMNSKCGSYSCDFPGCCCKFYNEKTLQAHTEKHNGKRLLKGDESPVGSSGGKILIPRLPVKQAPRKVPKRRGKEKKLKQIQPAAIVVSLPDYTTSYFFKL